MGYNAALQLALFSISLVLLGLSIAIATRRTTRNKRIKRTTIQEAHFRPELMRCLAEDIPNFDSLQDLGKKDSKYVESLIWNMLTKVRGASRESLVAFLDEHGLIDKEREKIYSHSSVRRALAAERLGNAAVPRTTRAVIRLLDDSHAEVRIVAARALGKMGHVSAVTPLLATLEADRGVPLSIVTMALMHMGPDVIDPLVPFLGNGSPAVRGVCAELLGMHGAVSAAKWLTLLLAHDPEVEVRIRSANALGRIGAPQGIEVLVRAIGSDNPVALRSAAALALGQIGGTTALGALQVALNDVDEQVSATAAESLAGLGTAGTDILALVAETEGPGQRRAIDWLVRSQLGGTNRRRRARAEV